MSQNLGTIYYVVEAHTDGLISAVKDANKSMDEMAQGFNKADDAAESLAFGLTALATAIKAVIAAAALKDMAEMVQAYQEMEDRIKLATRSTQEYIQVQDHLLETANNTYRSLSEAQELYILTANSLRGMGYTLNQALAVQDSLSYSFVRNATSAERAGNAIQAFTGAVNKGKVEADGWASIVAAIPSIVDGIAAATGKSAVQVRALGSAGKITAQQLTEGLRKSLDENAKAAAAMSNNLRDAATRMKTAFTQVLVTTENQTGMLQKLTDGLIKAANHLLAFGENADEIAGAIDTATTVGLAFAAVYTGRVITATKAFAVTQLEVMVATVERNRAEALAANATLRRALIEKEAAVAAVAVAKAEFDAARGTSAHAFAATALAEARLLATNATARYVVAQQAANAVMTTGTYVANGLKAAMGFLGGPVGVIMLASLAIYAFTKSTEDSLPSVELLTKAVNELGNANLRLVKIKLDEKIAALQSAAGAAMASAASVEYLKKQLKEFPNSPKVEEWNRRLKEQEAAAETAGEELGKYKKQLGEVNDELTRREKGGKQGDKVDLITPVIDDGKKTDAEKEEERKRKAIEDRIKDLQDEADMLGMTATEQELYKLQMDGATDAQIRSAATSLALTEAYKAQVKATEDLAAAEQKKKDKFGDNSKEASQYIRGNVSPLSGGDFDNQYARYEAEAKAEEERYAEQLDRLKVAMDMRIEVLGGYNALEEQMAREHADRIRQIEDAKNSMILSSGQKFFDSMASAVGAFAGESSSAYKLMFATAKAFAIADAGLRLSSAVAQAMADPTALTPAQKFANMAAVAAAGANVISQISSVAFSGRQYGGPVQGNSMYRVNEGGPPEVFNAANGQQFLLPNSRGEVVSNKNSSGGAGITNIITIQVDGSGSTSVQAGSSNADSVALAQSIRLVVVDELERQSRPNGLLWKMDKQHA